MQILRVIREQGPISRVDISSILQITRAAVTIITNEMIDQHILEEIGEEPIEPGMEVRKGRRKILLDINETYKFAIGVYIDEKEISIGLTTLNSAALDKKTIAHEGNVSVSEVLDLLDSTISVMLQNSCLSAENMLGIGIGIMPSMYQTLGCESSQEGKPVFPELQQKLEERTKLPIYIDSAITQFDASEFKCKLAGEVKGFDPETVVDKKEARKMARFTLLALAAAAEAIADSGLNTEAEAKNIGVVLSSGIGGLPTIEEQHTRGEEKGMEKVSPYFVPMSIANMAAAQVAIRFGLKGMCTCPVTACAGGTNAVGDAFHRIRDGYETAMVCGGAESCISPLGIGGFTSMKALSTATDPDAASLPFDARRGGFVMGEGSGVLVLEELEHARARGAHIYAEVVGYGANCDAYHFTAPAPGGAGAIDCMKLTLVDADIAPEQVNHINAHGTGTHMNDACETAAIHAVFGAHAKEMTVVSTKSMTGHLLGGAGGIEAVFTALALRDQFAPPTIHYAQPDPECDLDYVPNTGRQQEMQYALSNSLGFGGHNACIALRRWEG